MFPISFFRSLFVVCRLHILLPAFSYAFLDHRLIEHHSFCYPCTIVNTYTPNTLLYHLLISPLEMASSTISKPEPTVDFSEFDSIDEERAAKSAKLVSKLDAVRLGLLSLAAASAVTVMGTAGDALATYNNTTLGSEYIISMWPNEFDIRPTSALVACSTIVLISSLISLVGLKLNAVSSLQQ